jgi:hypothetical protein
MFINVQNVIVKTNNSITPNPIFADYLNEAISMLSSNKSYGKPFLTASFGSSSNTINGVANITSNLLNTPIQNMVTTYDIIFNVISFNNIVPDGGWVAHTCNDNHQFTVNAVYNVPNCKTEQVYLWIGVTGGNAHVSQCFSML